MIVWSNYLVYFADNREKVLTVLDWFFQHPELFPDDYRLSTLLWAREKAAEIAEYEVNMDLHLNL